MKKEKKEKENAKTLYEILQERWPDTCYAAKLPDRDGDFSTCFETHNFIDLLEYVYGLDDFILVSDSGFNFHFKKSDFSKKDIHRAGFIEAFDFVTHEFLTAYELDYWKIRVRTSNNF